MNNNSFNNSIVISGIMKYYSIILKLYNNSMVKKLSLFIDNYLKNLVLGSSIIGYFIKTYKNNYIVNSITYKATTNIISFLKRYFVIIKKWITSSIIVDFFKKTILETQNNVFSIIGCFGIGFFTSNIIFNLFGRNINLTNFIIKIILLALFILISTFKISLKSMLSTSIFYKLFKWMISY